MPGRVTGGQGFDSQCRATGIGKTLPNLVASFIDVTLRMLVKLQLEGLVVAGSVNAHGALDAPRRGPKAEGDSPSNPVGPVTTGP
jgi:hypothetical protein